MPDRQPPLPDTADGLTHPADQLHPAGRLHPATVAVTAGRPHGPGDPFNVAPTFASTFHEGGAAIYSRSTNPTWRAFEEAVGALEGGQALAFGSGLAAVSALLETLPPRARVVHPRDAYTGSRELIETIAATGRLSGTAVDVTDTAAVLAALDDADALWLETPTNPMLAIVDLATVLSAAAERGVPTFVDSTFATPILQQPLRYGATAVVHSATKFIGGHSDLLLGVVVTDDADLHERIHHLRTMRGAVPGTMEAWLALRGLRTLALRVERGQHNATVLAERLAAHRHVVRVRYPGLSDHPGHRLVGTQMSGPGAMLSFEVVDADAAERLLGDLRLIARATSLGGVETGIERRARWPGEEHVPGGLLRMSVGIEDVDDLWADLRQALGLLSP